MSEEAPEKWREDFPIEWGTDNYVTRREFRTFIVLRHESFSHDEHGARRASRSRLTTR